MRCNTKLFASLSALVWIAALFLLSGSASAQGEGILGEGLQRTSKSEAELKETIDRLTRQIETTPDNYRLHYELGNAYYDGGKLHEAQAAYEESVNLNPKNVRALVNLGSVLLDLRESEAAIEQFQAALAQDPEDCKARSNLGNAYYSLGRYPDAMDEYRRAIEIDDSCYSALYNIGVAFADAGMFREAVSWWQKVVKVAPRSEAAESAKENIKILNRFVSDPIPPLKTN
jgi:tetratricopeptide (TPR) repeat protein